MLAVGDDLGAHSLVHQHELLHAALHGGTQPHPDRGDAAHRAPEVIDVPHAGAERTVHLGPRRVRVAARDEAALTLRPAEEREGAWQFRRAGRDAHQTRGEVPRELRWRGVAPAGLGMTAHLVWREKRAIEMNPRDARATGRRRLVAHGATRGDHVVDLLRRAGRGRREDGGRPVPRVRRADRAHGVRRAVHEVGAATAVDVHVHEARRDEPATRIEHLRIPRGARSGAAHLRDASGAQHDTRLRQQAVGQDGGGVLDDDRIGRHAWSGYRTGSTHRAATKVSARRTRRSSARRRSGPPRRPAASPRRSRCPELNDASDEAPVLGCRCGVDNRACNEPLPFGRPHAGAGSLGRAQRRPVAAGP